MVLVTDGEQRAALALVRSLGRAGHQVYVCSQRGRSLAGASRYSRGEARVADALTDPSQFVADVATLVRRWNVDVLIPMTEASLLALLPARDRFEGVTVPFADAATFRRISDKAFVLACAPRFGIAVPEQHIVASYEDRAALPADSLKFPLVLKPARSVADNAGAGGERGKGGGGRARTKLSVRHAASWPELELRLKGLNGAAYPLLLQQRVVGPGVGIFLLLWEGETIALFSHRRIREKPPSGGVSVYRESIPAEPMLVDRSRALLQHFGWKGVAMIEYKVDAATGTPYLMEINGRFWGSLQLAVDAGVDFPGLLLAVAQGQTPDPVLQYRGGVRSRWWWGDVDHLLARLRHSAEELALPPDAPTCWQAARDFLRLWRPGDRNEVLRLDDPAPFLRETFDWFAGR